MMGNMEVTETDTVNVNVNENIQIHMNLEFQTLEFMYLKYVWLFSA